MLRWTAHLKGPKRQHAAVAVGHRVYSFGGYCAWDASDTRAYDGDRIDVHVFNTVSLRWKTLPPSSSGDDAVPSMRDGHTAVPVGDVIYVWGGFKYTRECCDVLYAFGVDTRRWSRPAVLGAPPEARCGHSACVVRDGLIYIYGGFNVVSRHTYSDIHKLNTAGTSDAAAVWSPINARGVPASVSECHSATAIGNKMYVFGGTADQIEINYNDVRVFDTDTDSWMSAGSSTLLLPEGRACHSAFAHDGELYIFGGANFRWDWSFSEEMWKFSPEAGRWTKVQPGGKTGPRSMSRMCCCVVGGRVVLFGGYRCIHTPPPAPPPPPALAEDAEDCGSDGNCDNYADGDGGPRRLLLLTEEEDAESGGLEDEDEGGASGDAESSDLYILDLSPSLKTLCKLEVVRRGIEPSELPHDIRWELAAMTARGASRKQPAPKTEETDDRGRAESSDFHILDLSPSLRTLCKLEVIRHGLEPSELPHDIRWELATMTGRGGNQKQPAPKAEETEDHWDQVTGSLNGSKRKARRRLRPVQTENLMWEHER